MPLTEPFQTASSFPRWLPLLGGLLGSTACGLLLYAFSVFIRPLMDEFGWSLSQVSLAYALACLCFGLVTLPAGRWSDRYGPQVVMLAGTALLAGGFYLVSTLNPPDPALTGAAAQEAAAEQLRRLYLFYGVIAGLGGGLVYLPPISAAPRWWPDRPALATGFTVVGLGLGSFIMAPLATGMINHFGSALPVFRWVSGAMLLMGAAAALLLRLPPVGYRPAGWTPPPRQGSRERDFTHAQARRTPQFWWLYAAYFCGAFAGLMVIGLIAKHGTDALTLAYQARHGLSASATLPEAVTQQLASAAALAPSVLAVFNAAVRVMIGPLADCLGTRRLFVGLFATQAAAMLLLFPAGSNAALLAAVAGLIGWNYGAMFTLFPATTLAYYGRSAQGSNYGLLFTAWGLAGFFGPLVGGRLQELTGSFAAPFAVAAALLAVGAVILALLKPPARLAPATGRTLD